MADTIPTGGAAPAAPVTPLPTIPAVTERLTVPASALGLETELPTHLQIPAKPDVDLFPAGPTGPAATAPEATPAATGPAATGPAAIPAPVTATAPATGPAPAENKVKIGDKEYTTKELEKILADRAAQNQPPQAPQAPVAPPAPPTAEQVAAAEAQWCDTFAKNEKLSFAPTETELETLLGGGKDAVEYFGKKLTDVVSKAVLLARKSVYADLNPQMEAFAARIEPLFNNHADVERVATEQAFLRAYPEYRGQHLETAKGVALALTQRYPEVVEKMSTQQFIAAVDQQTDKILQQEYKSWFPTATDTWRDAAKRNTTAPAPAPTPAPPVVPAPAPASAAQPNPWQTAPASASPAAIPASAAPDWNKSVAQSLRD